MKWDDYLKILQNISLRYFYICRHCFCCLAMFCYVNGSAIKIQQKFPRVTDYLREISYSVINDADVCICSFLPYQESKH